MTRGGISAINCWKLWIDCMRIASGRAGASILMHFRRVSLLIKCSFSRSLASEALESLGIIMALRAPEQLQVPTDTNKRKKRRLDASPAPSDVSSARASPAPPGGPPTPSLEKVSRSLSRSLSINTAGQGTSSPGPEPTPSTATTSAATPSTARSVGKQQQQQATQLTRKERKEAIVAQLPLKEGRPVAFKPSAKAAGKGAKTEDGDLAYFLTRVVRCIAGDKNRYEVQDVQDEHEVDGKPGASYNTTLKHLIVLPDPRDKSTYPINHYAVGTDVIAMYPDTTEFYRAKVVATPGNKRQSGNYKVIFEDDDNRVMTVSTDYVAEPSDAK
ncbi:hypothetical protein P389DRAFT_61717 [Cystobasidium minutum MCA 4210]|uniref:uncharacterized protein n=1 Tax=Cystobasidium minutum MCA 4210 TaxID=1397322 RepID=UPI0034CE5AFF|eukprot:jgi/Rhomi1/61717/CE61716_655